MNTYVRTCMCTRMYVRLLINTLDPLINDPKGRLIRGRGGRFNRGPGLQGGACKRQCSITNVCAKLTSGNRGVNNLSEGGGKFNRG